MIRTALLPALLAAVAAWPAQAHEFWVEPARFWTAPATASPLTLMVGLGGDRERWSAAPSKARRLRVHAAAGVSDGLPSLRPPGGDADARLTYGGRGLRILEFESRSSLSTLPAERFTTYLADEGLGPAIAWRVAHGSAGRPGRERYSRRAKALVQVGEPRAEDDAVAVRPVGLTLEIVPLRNPYRLARGEPVPLRVLYDGRPLSGALVKLFCLDVGHKPIATQRSDADGTVSFQVPATGDWLVTVVWTRPVRAPEADFETVFSSLTFGFSGRRT